MGKTQIAIDAGRRWPDEWCSVWKPHVTHPVLGEVPFQPYPYQAKLMAAFAKRQPVLVNKARQIGISTTAMIEAVRECVEFGPMLFVVGSRKEEIAKDLIKKAALAARTHRRPGAPELTKPRPNDPPTQEITWANGSRIVAETASPEMARGYSASVFILDEAAYLPDQEAIWASMRPTVSRTSRVWVVSTPSGEGDAFHRMWEDETLGGQRFQFTWRECPEYDEVWYARERPAFTQEAWAREFECDFAGSGNVPFRPDVIRRCIELGEAAFSEDAEALRLRRGRRVVTGVDPAGEGDDESVAVDVDTGATPWVLIDGESWQSVPAPVLQAGIESHRARHDSRLIIENNGLGWAVAQNLLCPAKTITTTSGRGSRVEKGNWTVSKTLLLNALIVAMENGQLAIPMGLTDSEGRPVFAELRKQLSSYRWDDKGLRTDWVMALADAVWVATRQPVGEVHVYGMSEAMQFDQIQEDMQRITAPASDIQGIRVTEGLEPEEEEREGAYAIPGGFAIRIRR